MRIQIATPSGKQEAHVYDACDARPQARQVQKEYIVCVCVHFTLTSEACNNNR